jgi:diguanylate cyclase (GGDEF)-like protein
VNITKEMLLDEIRVLQKASALHAQYSISQYKQVLKTLEKLEQEKMVLEDKVKQRTKHLEVEIQQKENLANELEKLAKYDQLTGLANRYLFLDELEIVYKEAKLLHRKFAVFFIDLDGFKLINDTYGHKVGDVLLQTVSLRLKKLVRQEDVVSRIGGDEFTIILKNINDIEMLKRLAKSIIKSIKQSIQIEKLEISVGSSVGIYIFSEDDTYEEIVPKADIAMYEAKKTGKGKYVFFNESMQKELYKITSLKIKIRYALEKKEFVNYFQPIVLSTDKQIKSAEVLIRWIDNGEVISPNIFIPIIEEDMSLIQKVTFWQIEEVVKLMQYNNLSYSVNISAKLLTNNSLIDLLTSLVKKYSFDTNKISFEVTETTLSVNLAQASKILFQLKKMGFNLSLDDFGTGYSSLAYIRELPLDTIKIDKKFIDNINFSQKDRKLLVSIINMAKILNMKIIIEGIENKEQLKILQEASYIKYQGFYFYKPMRFEELSMKLSADHTKDAKE